MVADGDVIVPLLADIRRELSEQRAGDVVRERQLERLATLVESVTGDIEALARVVRGNGSPGLVARVQSNEQSISNLHDRVDRTGGRSWDLAMILVAAFVSAVMGAGITAAVFRPAEHPRQPPSVERVP